MQRKSNAGRKKAITSPEVMWKLFCEYKKFIKSNPVYIIEQRKGTVIMPKGAEKIPDAVIKLPAQRPLTMEGFENFVADTGIMAADLTDYFENKQQRYSEFVPICRRIRMSIRQDQIEGGMVGIYNPSITQRLNGLTEKVDESGSKEVNVKVTYERKNNNTSGAS